MHFNFSAFKLLKFVASQWDLTTVSPREICRITTGSAPRDPGQCPGQFHHRAALQPCITGQVGSQSIRLKLNTWTWKTCKWIFWGVLKKKTTKSPGSDHGHILNVDMLHIYEDFSSSHEFMQKMETNIYWFEACCSMPKCPKKLQPLLVSECEAEWEVPMVGHRPQGCRAWLSMCSLQARKVAHEMGRWNCMGLNALAHKT